jgi:hypothetical protein
MDSEPTLRKIFDFDDGDLKANHQGHISTRQKQRLAWRRFFPRRWWYEWFMTLCALLGMIGYGILLTNGVFAGRTFIVATIWAGIVLYTLINRYAVKLWLNHHRDIQAETAECLYGRVLHLPNNHLLVGERKLGPLSTAEQQAFEHNAYYMVYIAPHSGDILAAEIAEKPKYDED